jgi:hydroxypyruvate isomerase
MPRFAANLSFLYQEHRLMERLAAAARDGFTAVEYMFPFDFAAADDRVDEFRSGVVCRD